jgi:hypothetical protein
MIIVFARQAMAERDANFKLAGLILRAKDIFVIIFN